MDLVSTYVSDDDEITVSGQKSKPVKEIDVIEITDSDSDAWSPVKSNPGSAKKKIIESDKEKQSKPAENSTTKHSKEIECIDIDESDCDEPIKAQEKNNAPNTTTDNNVVVENDAAQSKKIDYLNLEGSDSENEQQLVHEKVENLLNSAAILCDTPCGPETPATRNEVQVPEMQLSVNKSATETHNSPSPVLKISDGSLPIENKTFKDNSLHNQEKIISSEIIANKRFKRESETPKSTISGADIGENEEFTVPTSFMYRKDERITGAFAKSVVCRLPRQITRNYISHANIITSLQWCIPQYSHLLLSASADCSIKVWDMCCRHSVQNIKDNLGLKAAKWSLSGEQIIAGGYGKKARVFDVLSGML